MLFRSILIGLLLLSVPALAQDSVPLPTGMDLAFFDKEGSPGMPTSAPPTAADVAGDTFKIEGTFTPWVCSGCSSTLAKGVQASLLPASTTLTGADIAAAGNLPAATNGTVMTTADAAAIEASKQPGVLSHPFTWMTEQTVGAVADGVTAQIERMQQMTGKFLPWWLQFAVIAIGLGVLWGRMASDRATRWIATVMIVMISVSVGSQVYQKLAINPIMGLPAFWQQFIVNPLGVLPATKEDGMLDAVFAGADAMETRIMKSAPSGISNIGDRLELAFNLGIAHFLIVLSEAFMWQTKAALRYATFVALELGPLLIPFLLFDITKFVFWNWVWLLITGLVGRLVVDLILSMYAGVMAKLLLNTAFTGNPAVDVQGFWTMALIMVSLGASVPLMASVATIVFGRHLYTNMNSAGFYMSAGPLTRVARQAARGAI